MIQDPPEKTPSSLNKQQQVRQQSASYSATRALLVTVSLVVAILCTLLASTSLRGTALRGISAVRLPVYKAASSLRLYTPTFAPTDSRTRAVGVNDMASIQKVKAEDCDSSKAEAKLTPAEEARWNRLAEGMQSFHNHFRYEFDRVYTLADGGFHKEGMSLGRFLREAQQLSQHLTMHHRIEAHFFPLLAKKMPQFKAGARESGQHLKSHQGIHDGLDKYDKFLREALADSSSYNASVLRGIMDGFRQVLFRHLDEEVNDLRGESLRAAGWTLRELSQLPM